MRRNREELARELERYDGNVRRTAAMLGIRREWLYRLIRKHELWPVVNRARVQRIKHEPRDTLVQRARAALRG